MGALLALVTITGLIGIFGLVIHLICRFLGGRGQSGHGWSWTWIRAWLSAPKEETMKISKCTRKFHPNGFMISSDSDLNLSGGGSFRRFDKTDPDRDYQLLRQGSTVSIPSTPLQIHLQKQQSTTSTIPPQPLRPAPVPVLPQPDLNSNCQPQTQTQPQPQIQSQQIQQQQQRPTQSYTKIQSQLEQQQQGSVDSVFGDSPGAFQRQMPLPPRIPPPPTAPAQSHTQSLSSAQHPVERVKEQTHRTSSLPQTFSMTNPFLPLFQASTQFFSQTLQGLQSFQNNGNGESTSSSSSSQFQYGQEDIQHHHNSASIGSGSGSNGTRSAGMSMGELLFSSPPPNLSSSSDGGGGRREGNGPGLAEFFSSPPLSDNPLESQSASFSPTSVSTSVKLDSSNPFSPQSISTPSPEQITIDLQTMTTNPTDLDLQLELELELEKEHENEHEHEEQQELEHEIENVGLFKDNTVASTSPSESNRERRRSGHSICSWSANQGQVSAEDRRGQSQSQSQSHVTIENEIDNWSKPNKSTTTTFMNSSNSKFNRNTDTEIYNEPLNGNSIFDQIRDFNQLSMIKNEETAPSLPSYTQTQTKTSTSTSTTGTGTVPASTFSSSPLISLDESSSSRSDFPLRMSLDSPGMQPEPVPEQEPEKPPPPPTFSTTPNNNNIYHSNSLETKDRDNDKSTTSETTRQVSGMGNIEKLDQNTNNSNTNGKTNTKTTPPLSLSLSLNGDGQKTRTANNNSNILDNLLRDSNGTTNKWTNNSSILSDLSSSSSTSTSISNSGHYPALSSYRNARSFSLRQGSTDSIGSAEDLDDGLPSLQRAMSCDSVSSDTSVVLGEDPPHPAGHLCIGLEYDSETADLLVNVMEAKEINGLHPDSTPFDSYVRVFLLPDKTTNMQTRVYRKSLNPIYKEKFMFGLEPTEFAIRSLVFYMYATDKFSNTLIGEGELKLAELDVNQLPTITWIQLTDTGQRGGDFGEIMFSLSYLPTAERLTVVVVKARNLKFRDKESIGDPFVKVYLLQRGKKVSKKKSSTKKGEKNPIFNEAMIFSVPAHSLQTIQLRITVADSSDAESNRACSLGHVIVGSVATGKPLSHWNQMLSSLRKPIAMWHSLRK